MSTNPMIDLEPLDTALELNRGEVVEEVRELIRRQLRLKAIDAFGTFEFDPDYDYKVSRGLVWNE